MLRSRLTQAVRCQGLELLKGGSECCHVQLAFEGKVITACLHPQQFELDKRPDGTNQMVRLRNCGAGWRFTQRQVAFERLVILLDLPPCLVQSRDLLKVKRRIATHQIQDACAAVSV